jgi:polar amino acid transport system substrate-binding protein
MPRLWTRIWALLALCFWSFALRAQDASLDSLKKRGVLRVGMEPGFLPFEMRTPKGEWIGFDVEMIRAFSAKIGVKPEFIGTKWDGIIPGLMAGKYDVITSGMTITEERAKTVLFSDPYYEAGLKVLLAKKSADSIKDLATLDQPQNTILVKLGTTGDIFASKNIKKAKIRKMDSEADAAQSIALGKGDAFIYDKPYLEIFESSKKGKVALMPALLSTEQFGLAAKKSDQALVNAFNAFLKEWKSGGGYQTTYKAMFEDLTWKAHFPNIF